LQANGGPTLTEALLPGSPALNTGQDGVTTTDQRGVNRPQGAHTDIGAFELTVAVRNSVPPPLHPRPTSLAVAARTPDPVATVNMPGLPLVSFQFAGRGRHRGLVVGGAAFVPGSVVLVNGRPLRTLFVSSTGLLVPNLFGQMSHVPGAGPHHRSDGRAPVFLVVLVPGVGISPPTPV
jgi:hypothetical protein